MIDESAVNALPFRRAIGDALEIDPWGLISWGASLSAVQAEDEGAVKATLKSADIERGVIGSVEAIGAKDAGPGVFTSSETDATPASSPYSNVTSWDGTSTMCPNDAVSKPSAIRLRNPLLVKGDIDD